jgi:hypothetical protein
VGYTDLMGNNRYAFRGCTCLPLTSTQEKLPCVLTLNCHHRCLLRGKLTILTQIQVLLPCSPRNPRLWHNADKSNP